MSLFNDYFVVWDVESTSKIPTEDHIISIGAVVCSYSQTTKTFVAIDSFHIFVHTTRKIEEAAFKVHGISAAKLRGQPDFVAAIPSFKSFLQQYSGNDQRNRLIFMAHNGRKFDDLIMYCNFVERGMDFAQFLKDIHFHAAVDTLVLLKHLFKKAPQCDQPRNQTTGAVRYTLGDCFSSFCPNKTFENAHDALADSRALIDVLNSRNVQDRLSVTLLYDKLLMITRENYLDHIRKSVSVPIYEQEQAQRQAMTSLLTVDDQKTGYAMPTPCLLNEPTAEVWCMGCVQMVPVTHSECTNVPAGIQSMMN